MRKRCGSNRRLIGWRWLLLGLMLGSAAVTAAAAHRCVDPKGRVTIQQKPCDVPPQPPEPPFPCPLSMADKQRAIRLENQFLVRYPTEAAHRQALTRDLQEITHRLQATEAHFHEVRKERKAVDEELKFYEGKPTPPGLQVRVDANDAKLNALAFAFQGHEREIVSTEARFRCSRDTYGRLWTGAVPGSSGCNRPACAEP